MLLKNSYGLRPSLEHYGSHWEEKSCFLATILAVSNAMLSSFLFFPPQEVVPGIFQQGADSSDEGAKMRFQCTINAKNLRKIVFHFPTGGLACSDGDSSP